MTVYNKASLVLAESPAYKAGKIQPYYPLTPDVSFDFTRATSATRVNASGNIEKETQNLLLQSNQFDTTWTESGSTGIITSGFAGYDGSNDAWQLEHKASQYTSIRQSVSTSGTQTFSCYAKAGTLDYIILYAGTPRAWFNVSSGVVGSTTSTIDASITSVGGGWYRCSITFDGSITTARIYPNDASGTFGTTTGTIYIQDAQLEQGLVARNYQETTTTAFYGGITDNVPRLDYTDGSCPSVLLEPQRTNLSIQSEYITGSGAPLAIQSAGMTISYNQTTSPESVDNAMKWTEASNNGLHWGGLVLTGTSVGDDLTISIFAKRGTSDDRDIIINIYDGATSDRARYNLDAGTIVTDSAASNQPVVSMEDYGNGWWRCIYTRNLANSGYNAVVGLVNGTAPSWQGNGTSNIYTYGLQYEVGSYATSYIPTYGTSVTRNADAFQNSTNDKPLGAIGQGTWFVELQKLGDDTNQALYLAPTSSNTQQIRLHFDAANARFRDARNGYLTIGTGVDVKTSMTKMALSIDTTSGIAKAYANGSQLGSDYTLQANTFEFSRIVAEGKGFILKQSLFFPTALTDDECVALTTL